MPGEGSDHFLILDLVLSTSSTEEGKGGKDGPKSDGDDDKPKGGM